MAKRSPSGSIRHERSNSRCGCAPECAGGGGGGGGGGVTVSCIGPSPKEYWAIARGHGTRSSHKHRDKCGSSGQHGRISQYPPPPTIADV